MGGYTSGSPLFNSVISYGNAEHSSFHTPGHKSVSFQGDFFEFYKYDATELSVTDELYSPEGCIAEAENSATELFGSFHTFFSAGGASQCVKAALGEFAGKKVLFDRNLHFSAAAAIAFYGIDAVFVWGKCDAKTSVPTPPTSVDFREALAANPDAKAVFLTSPNYFGVSSDCAAIREVCDEYGVTFIDDNSHGSHYRFCFGLCGTGFDGHHAHVVIDSAHKTLPVMTGGALLHYNKEVSLDAVRRRMMAAGSTSPSFPILASIDHGLSVCASNGENLYNKCGQTVGELKKTLRELGFVIADGENIDPLRLSVYFGSRCSEVAAHLERMGIYPEMQANGFIVFIVTPFNKNKDIDMLKSALVGLSPVETVENFRSAFELPERVLSIRDGFFADREKVAVKDALGRVSAEMVSFHRPPCVPLCLPGERISESLVRTLCENDCDGIEVVVDRCAIDGDNNECFEINR